MPETQETDSNQDKANNKKKWRPSAWLWFVFYGVLVLTGLAIGSWYFKNGADRAKFWVEGLLSAAVLSVVAIQAHIYWKQTGVMEKALRISERAYVEVHSIETDKETALVTVKVENIGKTPATEVRVICMLYSYKDRKRYKPNRFSMHYERLSRGNFKIEFPFALTSYFTPPEVFSILEDMELPLFLQFRIHYHDGFQRQVSDSTYGYLGEPKNAWLPFADIETYGFFPDDRFSQPEGDVKQNRQTEE